MYKTLVVLIKHYCHGHNHLRRREEEEPQVDEQKHAGKGR